MFNTIIKIEEASNPMFFNIQEGAAKEVVDVAALQEKLLNELLSENKWIPIMSIKKGKVSTLIYLIFEVHLSKYEFDSISIRSS